MKGSGVWEIDALTAAWAVMSGINPARGRIVFETALATLETEKTILLGWPPLREDTKPYLGRSSWYPEGVRENGMYCHGVQWLVGAARILAEQCRARGRARRGAALSWRRRYRLWLKIAAIPHAVPGEIETYGGQPNKQAADMVTTFDPGRMIWNGYTGAAGWMFRQALEGVLGTAPGRAARSSRPTTPAPPAELGPVRVLRDVDAQPPARARRDAPPGEVRGAGIRGRPDLTATRPHDASEDRSHGDDLGPGRATPQEDPRVASALRRGPDGGRIRGLRGDASRPSASPARTARPRSRRGDSRPSRPSIATPAPCSRTRCATSPRRTR